MVTRVELEPGYILHRREYRDTSFLLDIWTEQYGRVPLVGRGMRGPKSRFQAAQPFQRFLISWSGRGELGNLSALEPDSPGLRFSGPLAMSGFYINELLTLFVHKHDPNPMLFTHYENALKALASQSAGCQESDTLIKEQIILRIFEKRLLEAIGYGIQFDTEIDSGDEILEDAWYQYDAGHGFRLVNSATRNAFHGKNLLSYGCEALDSTSVLSDAKRLMRTVLDYYLGGKVIKSRALRIAMEREKQQR